MNTEPINKAREALQCIVDMDPQGVRADDLGKAVRIALAALSEPVQDPVAIYQRFMTSNKSWMDIDKEEYDYLLAKYGSVVVRTIHAPPAQPVISDEPRSLIINKDWLKPGAVVPIDAATTRQLLTTICTLLSAQEKR